MFTKASLRDLRPNERKQRHNHPKNKASTIQVHSSPVMNGVTLRKIDGKAFIDVGDLGRFTTFTSSSDKLSHETKGEAFSDIAQRSYYGKLYTLGAVWWARWASAWGIGRGV